MRVRALTELTDFIAGTHMAICMENLHINP